MKLNIIYVILIAVVLVLLTYFITVAIQPKRVGPVYKTSDKDVENLMKNINAKLDSAQKQCSSSKNIQQVKQMLSNLGQPLTDACNTPGVGPEALIAAIKSAINNDPMIPQYLKDSLIPQISDIVNYACSYSNKAGKDKVNMIGNQILALVNAFCF
jgi:hypothetical protein